MKKIFTICLILCLIFTAVLTSLCGCDAIKLLSGEEGVTDNPKENIPDNSEQNEMTVPPTFTEQLWYSVVTDRETYNYGDEITVYVIADLDGEFARGFSWYGNPDVDVTFTVEESECFEIIGDERFVYNDIDTLEYIYGANKRLFNFSFKIKVNKLDTYVADKINITFNIIGREPAIEDFIVEEQTIQLKSIRFVTDSQGVLVASVPYSYNYWAFRGKEYIDLNSYESLFDDSFTREYRNGVTMEALINRYSKMCLGNGAFAAIYSNAIVYVSETLRFKIYVAPDNEYVSDRRYEFSHDRVAWTKKVLKYAYDSCVISAYEYSNELERLNQLEHDDMLDAYYTTAQFFEGYFGKFPNDDSYYNYVSDLR